MKRTVSIFLALIMALSLFTSVTFATSAEKPVITVREASGFATQTVDVAIDISKVKDLSGATLKIKYDTALELVSVANGNYFSNIADSAIYGKDTSGINGEFLYIGLDNGEDSQKVIGTLLTLTFKISEGASVGDKYAVKIDKVNSILTTGTDSYFDFDTVGGFVTVGEYTGCQTHSYEETTVSNAGYFTNGYSYKRCTVCGSMETKIVPATNIDAFDFMGVAMNYTGKPSGIAPMYTVKASVLDGLKNVSPDWRVEAGIIVYKDGKVYDEEVFFGEGATYQLVDNVLFVKVNDVSVYDKFTFKAYVKITDTVNNMERIAYNTAVLGENEAISICDVAKCLDLSAFSKENRTYLQNILDGFAN